MNLEKNQTIELPDDFFNGVEVELIPIDNIESHVVDYPMDITVESGYFTDSQGIQCKNCSSHSIEYLKKYGLKGLSNLNTTSAPANSASVLTGHLNTFLASMQANYAGALGIAYINIFYAPYLIGMNDDEMYQVAQEMIFNGSQNAFSRGGQTLFLDFNIHTGVPSYLKKVPIVGKGGKYYFLKDGLSLEDKTNWTALEEKTEENGDWCLYLKNECVLREHNGKQEFMDHGSGKVLTYGDFEEQARKFTIQLLNVWKAGDAQGRVFEFPKCDFHVSAETFEDEKQYEVYLKACELASSNGSTYFIFDRDEVTLSACCRLRTTIDDNHMLLHPESIRFCGFMNVTINIPQCAYRAKRKHPDDQWNAWNEFIQEIDNTMDIAVKAHLQKKSKIAELMSGPGRPLWQIGKIANDGVPYVDLDKCTYIIGLIGVNDAVKFLYGKEFHEDEHAIDLGLQVVSHMYLRAKHYTEQYGLKFTLEESPAESAARKLAKNDLVYFRDEAKDIVKGGDEDFAYYTNSVHLSADAPVCLVDRIEKQAMFHSVIESGAITHAFIGEEHPSADAIASLIREVFYRTQSAQVTFSPEFTYCQKCGHKARGLAETCEQCGSTDVVGETRVVGYFSKIQNWNKSKRYGELVARQKGRYSVMNAGGED